MSCCNTTTKSCGAITDISDEELRNAVRSAYAEVAVKNNEGKAVGIGKSCCGAEIMVDDDYCKTLGYTEDDLKMVVDGANMGLGCGNPTAIASLKEGDVVIDLGSGGGFDCFLAARRVGSGQVIGVDMTHEMLQKARLNAAKGGYTNVQFRLGEIEYLPVANNTADVVISNCVINLALDKPQVFREIARVLKPGGRVAISDIVATSAIPSQMKKDLELYSGCMAGATPVDDFVEGLKNAGLVDISIKVNEASRQFIKDWQYAKAGAENYVASATIQARKPRTVSRVLGNLPCKYITKKNNNKMDSHLFHDEGYLAHRNVSINQTRGATYKYSLAKWEI